VIGVRTFAVCVGMCAILGACASRPSHVPMNDVSRGDIGAHAIVSAKSNGMEVRWWFAEDHDGRVGSALAQYAGNPVALRDGEQRTLEASGVRITRIPLEDVAQLSAEIGTLGSRKRTWLSATGVWSEVYRGRRVSDSVPIMLGGRRTRLDTGILRMLGRVWIAHTLDGQILRADFATQLYVPEVLGAGTVFKAPQFKEEIEKGGVLRALSFHCMLDSAFAYVIVCEEPGAVWESLVSDEGDAGEREIDSVENVSTVEQDEGAFDQLPDLLPGPPAKRPLTLGEVLLSARAEETGGVPIKSVIVVIPRLPSEVRLLPKADQ